MFYSRFDLLSSSNPWVAQSLSDGTEALAINNLVDGDYSELAMQVTGPGTLAFNLATADTGNLAGVMVKVDDKEQRLLNNGCLDQGYSLTIPAGSHKISWLAYNHAGSTTGTLATLSKVSWPNGSSYSADPSCSLLTSATTNPDNDVVESDSGGGSLGWPVLGLLTGLAFWRRRRV